METSKRARRRKPDTGKTDLKPLLDGLRRTGIRSDPGSSAKCGNTAANRGYNRFVGMKADLAVKIPPDETDRRASAKFAASYLVTNAPLSGARRTWSSASLVVPFKASNSR